MTEQSTESDCLFCRIVAGELPADIVAETPEVMAFRDLNPQAPTHVLVIPKVHAPDALDLTRGHPELVSALVETAGQVAESEGLADGHRLVFNTGAVAGQTVFHVHLHLLGGRSMTWPPG